MSFFDELEAGTTDCRARFLDIPVIARGLAGQVSRETYLAFLGQAYHHVRFTVPLLMACGARLPDGREWLRAAIAEYIHEEIGHEEWILEDIANAGGDAPAVQAGNPAPATEVMVAYAFDTIERRNPIALFGMIYVLEGSSVALATNAACAIQKSLRLPDGAFRYLKSHGSLDQVHMQHFARLMNRLDDQDDHNAVLHAARMFYRLYGDVFESLPNDNERRNAA